MKFDEFKLTPQNSTLNYSIAEKVICHTCQDFTKILSNYYVLMIKTQNLHWNCIGPHFFSIHQLAQKQYEEIFEFIDEIAERIRCLGRYPTHTLQKILGEATLQELAADATIQDMIECMLSDHENLRGQCAMANQSTDSQHDLVSVDLLTRLMTFHEKSAWMLRSSIGQ